MAKDNNPTPNNNKLKINPWLIYGAVAMIFIIISFATNGSSFQEPLPITPPKFDDFLSKGQVDRVIVYNKTEGEVYLTPDAVKDKAHAAVSKDMLGRINKGPHYVFDIGNDEIFQKKLEAIFY